MQQKVLDSVQMYRHAVLSLPCFTQEEEHQLIAQARQGNEQARTQLIEGCLRYILVIAARYRTYVYHDSYLDLVGWGNDEKELLAELETVQKTATKIIEKLEKVDSLHTLTPEQVA